MAIRYQFKRQQRGSATLLVSLLILVGATLIVMFSARTSLMEQRISGNEIRTKQALNAAQAGLDEALAYLVAEGRGIPRDEENIVPFMPSSDDGNSTYRAVFWHGATPPVLGTNDCTVTPNVPGNYQPPPDPADDPLDGKKIFVIGANQLFIIYSCGWSDDRAARQVALVSSRFLPALPNPPTIPLIAQGAVDTNGRVRVFNFFNNLTIWSGGDLSITGNPGNAFIRNPGSTHDGYAQLPPEPNNCSITANYICTTDKEIVGPDIIDADVALSSLTGDQFFESFMGSNKAQIRAISMLEVSDANIATIDGEIGKSIWVEAPGATASLTGGATIGNRDNPVILVVNGDLEVKGNVEITGLLYVVGNLTGSGGITVYGSSIIEGEVQAGGTPYFIFDPVALANTGRLGRMAALPGSWHDWLAAP